MAPEISAALYLKDYFGVPCRRDALPVGVAATDELMAQLALYSGNKTPERYQRERGRLLDAYVDAHKYVFGKRALIYGDADFVAGLGRFAAEIGMIPILCAADAGRGLKERAGEYLSKAEDAAVYEGLDFVDMENMGQELEPDIIIGSSKGYPMSRALGVPLVRLGFPVHDRLGAARLRCLGYEGAQALFDRLVNALLAARQDASGVGYSYL